MMMNSNFFDYADYEEKKTRNSTFSKASESRDDIQRHTVSFYEKAFVHEQNAIGFYNPVDEEDLNAHLDGVRSPPLKKDQSGKSPSNYMSPVILDFLEDD